MEKKWKKKRDGNRKKKKKKKSLNSEKKKKKKKKCNFYPKTMNKKAILPKKNSIFHKKNAKLYRKNPNLPPFLALTHPHAVLCCLSGQCICDLYIKSVKKMSKWVKKPSKKRQKSIF
jgi:hypothetical protein